MWDRFGKIVLHLARDLLSPNKHGYGVRRRLWRPSPYRDRPQRFNQWVYEYTP